MKQVGIDLSSIEITINCSPEQLKSQVTASALHLLRNEKAVDQVPGRSDQQLSERRSEVAGEVTCEDFAGRRDPSITSIADKSHPVKTEAKEKF